MRLLSPSLLHRSNNLNSKVYCLILSIDKVQKAKNMLNISENSIKDKLNIEEFSSYQYNKLPASNRMLTWWLTMTLTLTIILFLLPWTQNIQMKGKLTTLLPEQRPHTVNSTIAGRIEKWYVREGDLVNAGDTIVFLSEVKAEIF